MLVSTLELKTRWEKSNKKSNCEYAEVCFEYSQYLNTK